jgi:hypothetical protein
VPPDLAAAGFAGAALTGAGFGVSSASAGVKEDRRKTETIRFRRMG